MGVKSIEKKNLGKEIYEKSGVMIIREESEREKMIYPTALFRAFPIAALLDHGLLQNK